MVTLLSRLAQSLAGRYTVERELGQGGMATVFLADDVKHRRKVALKVLKPELAAVLGAERFVQEITTTASLSHPHILPLFDSGTADGFLYYVMPFIDGETLRTKLDRETQFSVDEAVRITTQVADALDYAHRHGVIHRDIKPENILLHDGRPMVADFGIALALSAAAGGRMTETGLSLGTPHYMSPEQATAEKEISGRSDIYSLASVLFEMLTGNPPHTGASAQQIIMKIIAEPAEAVTKFRKSVPPHIAASLATALEKLPADRFATAKEFAAALQSPSYARTNVATRTDLVQGADWRAKVAVPALVVAAVALALVAWSMLRPQPRARVSRYEIAIEGFGGGEFANLALSRDGSMFVTEGDYNGRSGLFVRSRDKLEITELPGTQGAYNPTFSPDGRRIAYMTGPTIRIIDVEGGLSTMLTDSLVGVPGLAWGHDGFIYYDARGNGPLLRISEDGGSPEVVSALDTTSAELQHVWPDPLPNGKGVLIVVNRGGPGQGASETDGVAVLDLKTRTHRELFRGVYVRYVYTGHLLYVTREGDLMVVPFDQNRLEVTGLAVIVARGLAVRTGASGAVDLGVADDGTLLYTVGERESELRDVLWSTREGVMTPLQPELSGDVLDIAISPDGGRLAYIDRASDGAHVWLQSIATGNRERLTFEHSFREVAWRPDGRMLVGMSPPGSLFLIPADASAAVAPVARVRSQLRSAYDVRFTPSGDRVTFAMTTATNGDLFELRLGSDSAPTVLMNTASREQNGSVSPDGRWLLFRSVMPGNSQILVRPYPAATGGLRQVSSGDGSDPQWSPDGREVLYRSVSDSLIAVPVLPGKTFSVGRARTLFSMRGVTSWSIAPDGRRFLLVRERGALVPKRVILVENFHEELKSTVAR